MLESAPLSPDVKGMLLELRAFGVSLDGWDNSLLYPARRSSHALIRKLHQAYREELAGLFNDASVSMSRQVDSWARFTGNKSASVDDFLEGDSGNRARVVNAAERHRSVSRSGHGSLEVLLAVANGDAEPTLADVRLLALASQRLVPNPYAACRAAYTHLVRSSLAKFQSESKHLLHSEFLPVDVRSAALANHGLSLCLQDRHAEAVGLLRSASELGVGCSTAAALLVVAGCLLKDKVLAREGMSRLGDCRDAGSLNLSTDQPGILPLTQDHEARMLYEALRDDTTEHIREALHVKPAN